MQLQEARAHLAAIQTELVGTYKIHSESLEAKSKALEQLEVVRDNYARQTVELDAVKQEERRLRTQEAQLRDSLKQLQQARDVSEKELEVTSI